MIKKCKVCNKSAKNKFCSLSCYWKYSKLHPNKGTFKKGFKGEKSVNWKGGKKNFICDNCGNTFKKYVYYYNHKFCSRKCMGIFYSKTHIGEKHQGWKGHKVKYTGLHMWVYSKLGKPTKCEHCGKDGLTGHKIQWANKSGLYKRDLTDWIRLCVSCHKKYDIKLSSHKTNTL